VQRVNLLRDGRSCTCRDTRYSRRERQSPSKLRASRIDRDHCQSSRRWVGLKRLIGALRLAECQLSKQRNFGQNRAHSHAPAFVLIHYIQNALYLGILSSFPIARANARFRASWGIGSAKDPAALAQAVSSTIQEASPLSWTSLRALRLLITIRSIWQAVSLQYLS